MSGDEDLLDRSSGPHPCSYRRRWAWGGAWLAALVAAAWLLTSVAVIAPGERGLYERYGVAADETLLPGAHGVWPWPWGRVRRANVARVSTTLVGVDARADRLYLTGNSTELVAIAARLTYQIDEDPAGLRDYFQRNRSPERALAALAEQVVARRAAGAALDELLTADRVRWSGECLQETRRLATEQRLGLRILDFAILHARPPSETEASHRDVLSARIDARREFEQAQGAADTELARVRMSSDSEIADARVAAAKRQTESREVADLVESLSQVGSRAAYRHAIFCREWARELSRAPLVLVDADLADGLQFWFDESPDAAGGAP